MPDVDQLQARIVQLEDVVATLKAQAEAAAISAEQAGQAMEQRYSALAEGHGKVAAQKDKLQRENLDLREELTTARAEVHQLQTALMSRDAELEKKRMEITSLQQDKSSLDKLLQEKQAEIQELQTRLQAAVDRNVSLTEANTQLDGKLHEAQAAHSRAQLTQARVEQEKEILEKSNAWLNAELARKSDAYMAERRKSHEALLELQRKLAEAESSAEQLQGERERLLEKCTHQAKAAEEASTRLREVREEAAVREEQWEAEVALAQRMSQLYRDNSEERARKCKELEGIVQELKAHVESAAAANAEALQKAEAARQAAEQRVEEEQAAKEKLMQAAASGLPFAPQTSSAHTPSQHAFAITPSSGVHSSPSATELYIKLVEAQDQLRSERLKGKRQEILMEELCSEVEKRADLVREQQTEYERVKAAYLGVSSSLEALSGEKRDLEARLLQLEAENRRNSRERRSLEQQVQDLSHQLQTLLYEMQSAASGGQTTLQVLPSFSGGDVNDVTTQVLLEFKNIQELQQQNQRLLAVNRQLGAEVESGKAEAEAAVRAEYETAVQRLSAELEQLRSGRKDTEELLAQVVRQRNLLTSFLQDSGNDPDAARRAYAQSIGQMSLSRGVTGQGGQPPVAVSQAQVDTRMSNGDEEQQAASALIEDLQQQLSQLKEDASKTQEMMAQDLTNAKGEAASSRTDAARARAEAEFERERSNRLTESLKMQRHQIESLMTSAAKQQALVTDMERKLGELQASADEAKDKARQESMRAQGLEAELRVVSAAERRASNEASSLSSDKFRLAAELEAARGAHAEREGELVKELSRLREELGRTRKELSEGEKELAAARSRAEVAVNAADVAQSSSQQALQKLEEEVRQLRESLSSAQQRATAGEAKLELLQEAVRKAEERAARLEMEKNSRAQTSAGGLSEGSSTAEAELAAEVKLLREELNAAQEVAAAATGHARQYEMLARTSDEALNSMQADHEKFKVDANARYASVSEEIEKLRGELHAKEEEMREAKQAEKEFAAECERLDHEHHQERKQLKAEASAARAECQAKAVQVARLREEVDVLQKQYEDAKRSYDNEVVQHGDALKRYAALDVAHTALQQRLSDAVQQLDKARTTKAQAEAEFEVQRCELQQKMVEAERRLKQLIEHRDVLQRQLEKAAEEATGEGGDYADALRLLRQEREAVEIRLQLTERENTRLRQEAAVARQSAEEARVQLSTEAERARSAVRAEQDQAVLMQKVEQFNLIRESNAALRAENSKLSIQLREATKKLRAAEAELLPLQQRISGLKADNESAAQELASVKEQQERWQQRAIQLSQRYDAVDKQEYQRVTEELKLSQQALQEREDALKTMQNKMVGLEEQLAHERGRSAELQGKLEQVGKESVLAKESLQQVQRDLDAAKDEIEKYRKRANSIWTIVVQTCNKEKLPMAEWRVAQAAKEHRLVELEERIKILQGQQEGSASAAAAEMTTLQVKISQLQSDLATAQHEAEKAKASLSEVKRRTIETAKKAAASKQQAEAEAAKFKAALNGKEARCREMSEQLDALKKEKTELAFRAKALQEDLEKTRRATYSKDVSDRMGAHNTGSAEAKRELEDIRDKAQAQQRNKLEAKRKLESYESTHENAQLAESPDGDNLRKEDQNVGDDRQDEAPMSKRNKLTTEPTTREYGDLTTQGDVVSLTDINDEADQHELGGELEQGFGQEVMELMESGEAGDDEVPEDTLRQDRKGKKLMAQKLEHAQDDNEEEEAMVRSGTTVKDEVEEEDMQDAGNYEGQDVGIEEVIEYGQEEIGNEGGTEQHVDTRELNMEGSDCKDQKAENKSYHLKEVVVKDLSLQCFEDEQQDNADDYDQETTFEGEEVGDGIEHERHTSTDVQDEQEIKERQRQETQDQQEDDTFDSEEEGFREGEAHSDENDEEDNALLDNQEVLASHGHLPPNPENIFTERQLEHPSFESPSSVGVGRQGNPDKSPGEEPLGDQAEATKPRKRAIQWQPQPDASMKQGRGRGGRSSQIKSKVGPGRGRGTGS